MKMASYTLIVLVVYTALALIAPAAAVALTLPFTAAFVLPGFMHLHRRDDHKRRARPT